MNYNGIICYERPNHIKSVYTKDKKKSIKVVCHGAVINGWLLIMYYCSRDRTSRKLPCIFILKTTQASFVISIKVNIFPVYPDVYAAHV